MTRSTPVPTAIRITVISVLAVLILSVPSISAQERRPDPPSSPELNGAIAVAEQRQVEGDFGRILGLSPDGRWLAAWGESEICAYAVVDLSQRTCAAFEEGIDLEGVSWSPDGTRIAFTENSPVFFIDSDLWVFEVESGSLVNLTDDGYRGGIPLLEGDESAPSPLYMDLAPAWTPDGQALAFSRTEWTADGNRGTSIYRIDLDGGEPEPLLAFPGEVPFLVYLGMDWTPDGEHLLFTIGHPQFDHPTNGIWMIDADSSGLRQVAGATDPNLGYPMLMDISPQRQALVFHFHPAFDISGHWSPYGLLDITTGDMTLIEAEGAESSHTRPSAVGFSPDGGYLVYGTTVENRLILRKVDTGAERIVAENLAIVPNSFTYALTWAENGTIYAPSSPFGGTLLQLGDGGSGIEARHAPSSYCPCPRPLTPER